jgi:putative transposase
MDITLRFRAYPDEDTRSEAWRHIDIHRQIRNHAVRDYYRSDWNDRPSEYDQINKLPAWKRQWPVFADVLAHAAQQTVSQIHKDLTVLKEHRKNGRKTGRLRWKGSGKFRSVAYQSEGFNVDQNTGRNDRATLTLSKIGTIPIRTHREIPNTDAIKRVILKKERTGEWFACLVIKRIDENLPEKPPLDEIDRNDCVGIDLGILSFIHTSDDLAVGRLSLDAEYERYARAQRSLNRKEHGSNNWEKQRRTVAKTKRRIKRKVLDYQHKLATWLVKTYDVVAVEDLDVKGMLEGPQSAKNKQDVAWRQFIDLLVYKGDLHGTYVETVDPKGTTKECNRCGVETHKPVWIREHSCPTCGHEEDRDLNAAKNVLDRGLDQLFSIGQGLSDSTPVETVLPTFTHVRANAKHVVEAGNPVP